MLGMFPARSTVDDSVPLPDFMTRARRELIPSAVFLVFFVGAIVASQDILLFILRVEVSKLMLRQLIDVVVVREKVGGSFKKFNIGLQLKILAITSL